MSVKWGAVGLGVSSKLNNDPVFLAQFFETGRTGGGSARLDNILENVDREISVDIETIFL